MELCYDKDGYTGNSAKQYNGNIGATIWRSQGDFQQRKYQFYYDPANRIEAANFTQKEGSSWTNTTVNFDAKIGVRTTDPGTGVTTLDPATTYDMNGNIKFMQHWGLKLNGSVQIDDLSYAYETNSNKLKQLQKMLPQWVLRITN